MNEQQDDDDNKNKNRNITNTYVVVTGIQDDDNNNKNKKITNTANEKFRIGSNTFFLDIETLSPLSESPG